MFLSQFCHIFLIEYMIIKEKKKKKKGNNTYILSAAVHILLLSEKKTKHIHRQIFAALSPAEDKEEKNAIILQNLSFIVGYYRSIHDDKY